MTEDFVRDGFKYMKPVRDEYDSCKKESKFISSEAVWKFHHDVLTRKHSFTGAFDLRKKHSGLRDSIVPITDSNKIQVGDWFRELAGATPLHKLGRRVPYSKDKEEILNELLSNRVPISRAVWLVNMSVVNTTAHAETTKRKSRSPFDPTSDWTSTVCRMLKRILESINTERQDIPSDGDWEYLFSFLIALYDADLADHWEVLVWLVKRAESLWRPTVPQESSNQICLISTEESPEPDLLNTINFFLYYLLEFGRRFTENELITRRLLFWCCSVFSHISPSIGRCRPAKSRCELRIVLDEYLAACACPLHRSILVSLSSLICCLVLKSPSAAVWNIIPFETDHAYLNGSPLEFIPYSLSLLPTSACVRSCLLDVEETIIERGKLAESGWNSHAASTFNGDEMNCLVNVLDILDRQDYHTVREHNPVESLFDRIFNDDSINIDTGAIVLTLCEWAVSTHRVGLYRSIVVACLLEQLSNSFQSNPVPIKLFQDTLVTFLDSFAPNLPQFTSDQAPLDNEAMRNLVCLFSELIDREVFDHDCYVRCMIARGIFNASLHPLSIENPTSNSHVEAPVTSLGRLTPTLCTRPTTVSNSASFTNAPSNSTFQFSVASELSEDNDRCSMDNPDSVRSELGCTQTTSNLISNMQVSSSTAASTSTRSSHFHYLAQFPLPQDEGYMHEGNQRYQLLYGSLRARDRARCRVRQLARDVGKLFTRKVYLIDVVHGELYRRRKAKERDREKDTSSATNIQHLSGHRPSEDSHSIDKLHEEITSRFINLSYHDMECVVSQCMPVYNKMLCGSNGVNPTSLSGDDTSHSCSTSGPSNFQPQGGSMANPPSTATLSSLAPPMTTPLHIYMPVPSSIFLFFELIETSLNITCLLSTIVDTLERLQTLFEPRTHFMTLYMSFLCLRSIGILQRYQPILFTMNELSSRLFPTLIAQVRQVKEPTQCGPFERCILAYLNDLFTSNFVIKSRFTPIYGKAHPKVSALFRSVESCEGVASFDSEYATDLLGATASDNLVLFRCYLEDLRNNPNSRFSFVCKSIVTVCRATTSERVNYLCGLCAELTSQCSELTPEWLGSFYAVLAPRPYLHGYSHIVQELEPSDLNIYDALSSLIATLLSRHCFTIWDFLRRVICPAMAQGLGQPVGPQLQPSIRLACHILHRLFTAESTVSSLQGSSNVLTPNHEPLASSNVSTDPCTVAPPFRISEPLLLTGALQKVTPELLVDVLKMLIVHSDKTSEGLIHQNTAGNISAEELDSDDLTGDDEEEDADRGELTDVDSDCENLPSDCVSESTHRKISSNFGRVGSNACKRKRRRVDGRRTHNLEQPVDPVVQRFLATGVLPTVWELRSLPLNVLIQLVLREICTVPWVRERFYRIPPERLIRENVLIDKNFSPHQARHLLHIIFFPFDTSWTDTSQLASAMCQILSHLDLWTLRCSQMKFQLLYAQITFPQQSDVLGCVGQSIVRGFQTQAVTWLSGNASGFSADGCTGLIGGLPHYEIDENDPVWLLPSLVAELPKSVKVQIVKATLETLKGIRHFWKHKNDEDKESVLLQNSVILAHPAFFSLLRICVAEADPLDSLYEQIDYFVENARETEDRVPDNLRTRQVGQECLRLRLALVGQRFRALQTDLEASLRWALLLTQLISHGVTEPESSGTLFTTVYDMLQVLVHTLAAKSDLEGKHYQNFVKRVRRELSERPPSHGIEQIKPLLPPLKIAYTVIVTGRTSHQTSIAAAGAASVTSGVGAGSTKSGGPGKASNSKGPGKSGNGHPGSRGGSHSSGPRGHAKKRGLTVIAKERLAPWDATDPAKQSVLLSMHGATYIEAVPSRVEEQANRLIRHDHFVLFRRSPDFYLTPVYMERGEIAGGKSQALDSSVTQATMIDSNVSSKGSVVSASCARTTSGNPAVFNLPTSNIMYTTGTSSSNPLNSRIYSDGLCRPDKATSDSLAYEDQQTNLPIGQEFATSDNLRDADDSHPSSFDLRQTQSCYPPALSSSSTTSQLGGTQIPVVQRHLQGSQHSASSFQQDGGYNGGPLPSLDHSRRRRPANFVDRTYDGNIGAALPPLQAVKATRFTNKYPSDHLITSVTNSDLAGSGAAPATKRKRGPSRRGSAPTDRGMSVAVSQRVNAATVMTQDSSLRTDSSCSLNSKAPPGQMVDYQASSLQHAGSDYTLDSSSRSDRGGGTVWHNKVPSYDKGTTDPHYGRISTPMTSVRGFIRSRAQQQQRASTSVVQQRQQVHSSYSNVVGNQTVFRSCEPHATHAFDTGYETLSNQHSDGGLTIAYPSSVRNANTYAVVGDAQSRGLGSHLADSLPHSNRQLSTGPGVQRYVPQLSLQRNPAGMHPCTSSHQTKQQVVPNPPPYPIAQHPNDPIAGHAHQQHTFQLDSNEGFVSTGDNTREELFTRIGGSTASSTLPVSRPVHHHPSHQNLPQQNVQPIPHVQPQQRLAPDHMPVQLMHQQPTPTAYQGMPTSDHHPHVPPNPQTATQLPQFSRLHQYWS